MVHLHVDLEVDLDGAAGCGSARGSGWCIRMWICRWIWMVHPDVDLDLDVPDASAVLQPQWCDERAAIMHHAHPSNDLLAELNQKYQMCRSRAEACQSVIVAHRPLRSRRRDRLTPPAAVSVSHGSQQGRSVPAESVMGAHRHHPVGQVEGLLHAVPVVDVDVHVQHAGMYLKELHDGQHDVIHVAEPRSLRLLGMARK